MPEERHATNSQSTTELELRDISTVTVAPLGRVEPTSATPGVRLLDAAEREVLAVREYLASLLASGASSGTTRSYALDLLRWWRFLAAIEVDWQRATRVEVRDFVLWMRTPNKAAGGARMRSYAPATINHTLAVVRGFYGDRMRAGEGPLLNPVPDAEPRRGRRPGAHHNPMEPHRSHRAPFRQKLPARRARGIPDALFDELFSAMPSDRDRALLAFFISTAARASELLGVTTDRVDVGRQLIGVERKGSRRLQWLPASSDAFVWLRLHQAREHRPAGEMALWLTRREPFRPLSYSAMRRVLQRANDQLGTRWTLHQLRHAAARRMLDDPSMSLVDVQWLLGHERLTTTEIYLHPEDDEVVRRVLEHHRRRAERPPVAPPASGYRPEVLEVLFGTAGRG